MDVMHMRIAGLLLFFLAMISLTIGLMSGNIFAFMISGAAFWGGLHYADKIKEADENAK